MPAKKTTASRPTLQRKVTPASEKKRKEALDTGVRMTVQGEAYEVRMGDIEPVVSRLLRRETGMSWQKLSDELHEDPDVDTIATFVWFARIIRGDDIALNDVVVTYADMLEGFDIDVVRDGEVVDVADPEASAGSS